MAFWHGRPSLILVAFCLTTSCRLPSRPETSNPANGDWATQGNRDALGDQVRAYVGPLVANRDFSGVVRITHNDDLLFEEAFGYADFEDGVAHSVADRFPIASVSKTVTAAAIVKLHAEGRIDYDDLLNKYLPGFAHGAKIRVKHLLRFESGLAEIDTEERLDSQRLLDQIGARALEFEPGSDSRYGNSGFNVLAILVETISRRSFEEFLRDTFFDPLQMTDTGLRRSLPGPTSLLVTPYVPGPPPPLVLKTSYSNATTELGSGGLYSNARDLSRWGQSIARKEIVDLEKEDYPWGWGKIEIEGHRGLEQTGLQPGFTASLQVFPNDGIVIVTLNNIEAGMWADWAKDLAKIVFSGQPKTRPETRAYLEAVPERLLTTVPGLYRLNGDRFVVVKAVEGDLWLHLNDYPIGRYLLPLPDGGFQLRDFTGRVYFNRSAAGSIDSLTWKLPEAWNVPEEIYLRQD